MSDIFDLHLSEKFEKELVTFMLWISDTEYKISSENNEIEWSMNLLDKFQEPGRNKLECYIKELIKVYFISYKNNEINDIKSITKEFRENKSKICKQLKTKLPLSKLNKQNEKQNDKQNEKENQIIKKQDDPLYYIKTYINACELDYSTIELVTVYGMPKFIKSKYIQYQWNIDDKFIIYNWLNESGEFSSFETIRWYLAVSEKQFEQEFFEYTSCKLENEREKKTEKDNEMLICECCDKSHDSYECLRNHLSSKKDIQEIQEIQDQDNIKENVEQESVLQENVLQESVLQKSVLQENLVQENLVQESLEQESLEQESLEIDLDDIEF